LIDRIPAHVISLNLDGLVMWSLGSGPIEISDGSYINASEYPSSQTYGDLSSVVDVNADEKYYITPVGCRGILRRKDERGLGMNVRLEQILKEVSSTWTEAAIEVVSRRQPRGRFSSKKNVKPEADQSDLPLFGSGPE
jgi:DNA (cytosine-5)-methyltransferase 1